MILQLYTCSRHTRYRMLVLCFPAELSDGVTVDDIFLVLPLLHRGHFAASLLPALANDINGCAAVIGFNHSGQTSLMNQANQLWLVLRVLSNPAVYPEKWAKLTALSIKHNKGPQLALAKAFAIARLVIHKLLACTASEVYRLHCVLCVIDCQ
jgi:hypothetical protein